MNLRLGGLEFLDFPIFIPFESPRMKPYNLLSVYIVCMQVLVSQYITAKKPSNRLPVSHEFYKLQECCICLSVYDNGAELRGLPCHHHFHCSCIDKWLYINATCPLCKFNILKPSNQIGTGVV